MKKGQITKLDRLWAKLVKKDGYCCICGESFRLNAHHYITRSNRNIRWYLPNGFCLCSGHHLLKTQSAHKDPEWFREHALEMRGQEWLDDLVVKSRISCLAAKQIYKDELEKLKSEDKT